MPRQADGCRYPKEIILSLAFWALPVLDKDAGQILNFCQIHNHPKLAPIWNELLSNEMGRLCQVVGVGQNGKGQQVAGTDTFHVILFDNIPRDQRK